MRCLGVGMSITIHTYPLRACVIIPITPKEYGEDPYRFPKSVDQHSMHCLRVGMRITIHSLMVVMRIPFKSVRVGMEVPMHLSRLG